MRARIVFLPLTDTPATQGGATARAPTEDGQRGLARATPKQDKQTHNSRRERAPSGRTAVTGAERKKKAPQLPTRGLPERPRRARLNSAETTPRAAPGAAVYFLPAAVNWGKAFSWIYCHFCHGLNARLLDI